MQAAHNNESGLGIGRIVMPTTITAEAQTDSGQWNGALSLVPVRV